MTGASSLMVESLSLNSLRSSTSSGDSFWRIFRTAVVGILDLKRFDIRSDSMSLEEGGNIRKGVASLRLSSVKDVIINILGKGYIFQIFVDALNQLSVFVVILRRKFD
jgi:hypothetical protein